LRIQKQNKLQTQTRSFHNIATLFRLKLIRKIQSKLHYEH